MRFLRIENYTLAATVSAALLSGCSGGNLQPSPAAQLPSAPQSITGQARYNASAYVYTCAPNYPSGDGDCDVYDTSGHMLAQLTSQDGLSYPWGVTLFGGNWYIANYGREQVQVYTQGTSPKYVETLTDSIDNPVDVAVYGPEGKVKLVAVANNASPNEGPGGAVVYKDGATSPSYSLSVPSGTIRGQGIAFDSTGDCAFAYGFAPSSHERATGHVLLYKKCAGKYTDLGIAHLGYPGNVIFDQGNNMIVVDQKEGIRICTGTSSCNVALPGRSFYNISLSSAGTDLWITRYSTGEISDYAYPGLTLKFKFRPAHGKNEPTGGIAAN